MADRLGANLVVNIYLNTSRDIKLGTPTPNSIS